MMKHTSSYRRLLIGTLGASLLILSGCGSLSGSAHATSRSKDTAHQGTTLHQKRPTNEWFQTSLTLPNGKVVTPEHSVRWKDVSIQLLITSLPPSYVKHERYFLVVGNHSQVLSHERVSSSAGKVMLVLNERTPPAAADSTIATYEYWVIAYGSRYTYAIDATIVGNRSRAKREIMSFLHKWRVPMNAVGSTRNLNVTHAKGASSQAVSDKSFRRL